MRTVAGLFGLLAGVALAQPPADGVRYGIRAYPDQFPNATPKAAVETAIDLIARDRLDYLAAHLLDPAFVDAKVADRARRAEEAVERELRLLRDIQRQDRTLPGDARLPDDPQRFADRVRAEATARGFRQLVADVRRTLSDNPDHLKDLRRFLRAGQLLEAGDTASLSLAAEKGRAVYLKKTAAGWHLEDRRTDPTEKQ
jgi:hypothetical protein